MKKNNKAKEVFLLCTMFVFLFSVMCIVGCKGDCVCITCYEKEEPYSGEAQYIALRGCSNMLNCDKGCTSPLWSEGMGIKYHCGDCIEGGCTAWSLECFNGYYGADGCVGCGDDYRVDHITCGNVYGTGCAYIIGCGTCSGCDVLCNTCGIGETPKRGCYDTEWVDDYHEEE